MNKNCFVTASFLFRETAQKKVNENYENYVPFVLDIEIGKWYYEYNYNNWYI